MAVGELRDEALMAALRAHPELRRRVSSIVLAVEGGEGELKVARTRRKSGWSRRRVFWDGRRCAAGPSGGSRRRSGRSASARSCIAKAKKLRWHTKFGEIEVLEPQYRFGTQRVRPFALGAKVSPLGCSRPLQRAIVDFAADQPFAQARAKLEEHYGFAIGSPCG